MTASIIIVKIIIIIVGNTIIYTAIEFASRILSASDRENALTKIQSSLCCYDSTRGSFYLVNALPVCEINFYLFFLSDRSDRFRCTYVNLLIIKWFELLSVPPTDLAGVGDL